jgi:2-aminoethylphosphonate-pyruvate transaminase
MWSIKRNYIESWNVLIDGITRLGLTYIVSESHHSKIITAIIEPDCPEYDFGQMHDFFYSHGIMIYPGKLDGLNTFRIANMGAITYKDIEAFLVLLECYLSSIGFVRRNN